MLDIITLAIKHHTAANNTQTIAKQDQARQKSGVFLV